MILALVSLVVMSDASEPTKPWQPSLASLAVAVVDRDGDGSPEILTAHTLIQEIHVRSVTQSDQRYRVVSMSTDPSPSSVAVADLDGDGKLDVVVGCGAGRVDTFLKLGNGDSTRSGFASRSSFYANRGVSAVAVADFNGDGHPDLVAVDSEANGLSLLFNKGAGRGKVSFEEILPTDALLSRLDRLPVRLKLSAKPSYVPLYPPCPFPPKNSKLPSACYATGEFPEAVAVGDFNGDGKPDLAVANGLDATVGIFLNKGDGTFRDMVAYPVGKGPMWLAVGDFDGDGKPDLAVADFYGEDEHGRLSLLRGKGDGTFEPELKLAAGPAPVAVVSADFDGDGRPDLAVAESGQGVGKTVTVLRGLGGMKFAAPVEVGVPQSPNALAVGDMDGDGKPDLVVATTQGVVILHNLGAKGFER